MNTTDDLTRSLQEQADRIGGHPIDLDSVRGKARSIQRRRRAATAVVAAAVLAVTVPVGITVAGGLTDASLQPAPAPVPTPQKDGSFPLTIEGLPAGEPAKIGYIRIDEKQLVMPGGTVDTPEAYVQISPYGPNHWLALRAGDYPPSGYQVVELTEDFDVVSSVASGPAIVLNQNFSRFAWVEIEGGQSVLVTVVPFTRTEPTRTTIGDGLAQPVGFLPGGRVVFSSTDQATAKQSFGVVAPGGKVTELNGFLRLYDASEANGLVAGQTEFRRDGTSCAGVLANSRMVWDTCDHTLGRFSPDGRYVVGLASQSDGLGSPTVSVLAADTGDALVDFRPANGEFVAVNQVEWEDDDTLLATVTQGRDQALLRLEMDGRVELVDGPFRLRDLEIKLRFAEHPAG
jgi:hypothetical protein